MSAEAVATDRDARRELVEQHLEAEQRQDAGAFFATLHPTMTWELVATAERWHGLSEVRPAVEQRLAAFPGWTIRTHALHTTEDGHAFAELTLSAYLHGPLYGVPPRGQQTHLRKLIAFEFLDDQISARREYYDQQSLLIDLGALPNTTHRVARPAPLVFQDVGPNPMRAADMLAIQAEHTQAEFALDLDRLMATIHPGGCWEDVPTQNLRYGKESIGLNHYRLLLGAFSDWGYQRRHFCVGDGYIFIETRLFGRQTGQWYDIPPTGGRLDQPLAVVFLFKDGLVLGEREYYDRLTVLRGFGLRPEPTGAA